MYLNHLYNHSDQQHQHQGTPSPSIQPLTSACITKCLHEHYLKQSKQHQHQKQNFQTCWQQQHYNDQDYHQQLVWSITRPWLNLNHHPDHHLHHYKQLHLTTYMTTSVNTRAPLLQIYFCYQLDLEYLYHIQHYYQLSTTSCKITIIGTKIVRVHALSLPLTLPAANDYQVYTVLPTCTITCTTNGDISSRSNWLKPAELAPYHHWHL